MAEARIARPGGDDAARRRHLRAAMLARRGALTPAEHAALSAAVRARLAENFPQLAGRCIGFCWPVHNEPDLLPLLERFAAAGSRLALPVVTAANAPLLFRAWAPGEALLADRYGIPTPLAGAELTPEALLMPVNAFDAANYRLGYGGGFFDRSIAAMTPRPLCIGVGFDFQRVASIWPQAHDQPLDAVLTERRCQRRE